MKIAIDLMGGEGCGEQNLDGCLAYPYAEELIVIGDIVRLDQRKISVLVEKGAQLESCAAALTGNETSRALLKRSHGTSLAIGMQMLADKKADALVSSADTKAMMALGRSFLGTVAGLYRPAIAKAFLKTIAIAIVEAILKLFAWPLALGVLDCHICFLGFVLMSDVVLVIGYEL